MCVQKNFLKNVQQFKFGNNWYYDMKRVFLQTHILQYLTEIRWPRNNSTRGKRLRSTSESSCKKKIWTTKILALSCFSLFLEPWLDMPRIAFDIFILASISENVGLRILAFDSLLLFLFSIGKHYRIKRLTPCSALIVFVLVHHFM